MSVGQHIAIALRKERLLARIDVQRSQLASFGAQLEKPFAVADKAIQVGRYLKQRPWIAGVAALAVVVLTFFLILLFWDTHRVMASGLIALAYVLIGVCCALAARQRARVKSKLFAASLAELAKDEQRLSQP